MADDLYLILHKVRGAPAFDIASKETCSHCNGVDDAICQCDWHRRGKIGPCNFCKGEGFWWIVPTSGHRAYPHVWAPLVDCLYLGMKIELVPVPDDLPDHYDAKRDNADHLVNTAREILLRKGMIKAHKPAQPAYRRI